MSMFTTPTKRCQETRAHYAHEWYNPLRQNCPGGPDEALLAEPAADTGLRAAIEALADEWAGDEDDGIDHVVACQDFACKTCVVIACATDLRAVLADHAPQAEEA